MICLRELMNEQNELNLGASKKSLDASGGSVFRIMADPAMLE